MCLCAFVCVWVCCSHSRLGPRDHHHAQGDAFVEVPLLYGGGQADDSHQQQGGVFTILRCHLSTHTRRHTHRGAFQNKSLYYTKIYAVFEEKNRVEELLLFPPSPTSLLPPPPFGSTLTVCHLFFLICSTSHPQGSRPHGVV